LCLIFGGRLRTEALFLSPKGEDFCFVIKNNKSMAQRRMFSRAVVRTDKFLDMSPTAQNLYFHFGIEADDDGFVSNPKSIMKSIGAPDDDIRILEAKGFIIPFEKGILVITHWKENNYIQADRYKPTVYQDELKLLDCEHNVYKMDTQVRLELGKSKSKVSIASNLKVERVKGNTQLLTDYFFTLKGWNDEEPEFYKVNKISYARHCKDAKDLLELCNGDLGLAKLKVEQVKKWCDDRGLYGFLISTAIKKFVELK
jgi:hypothetical protein